MSVRSQKATDTVFNTSFNTHEYKQKRPLGEGEILQK